MLIRASPFLSKPVITLALVTTNIWGAEARIQCHETAHLHQPFELLAWRLTVRKQSARPVKCFKTGGESGIRTLPRPMPSITCRNYIATDAKFTTLAAHPCTLLHAARKIFCPQAAQSLSMSLRVERPIKNLPLSRRLKSLGAPSKVISVQQSLGVSFGSYLVVRCRGHTNADRLEQCPER